MTHAAPHDQSARPYGRWDIAVLMIAVVWFGLFLALSVLQYETGHSRSFDLALYARSLWGIAYGEPINSLRDQHVLALHGHWILYPLAPLARVVPTTHLLLTLQTLALAAGAVVTYRVAVRRLGNPGAAFAVALMYLAYPVVTNTALFDMHVKTLAAPFLIVGIDRFDRLGPRDLASWALLLMAFSCREEIALSVGLMGACWLLFSRTRKSGAALAVAGLLAFGFYFFVVQPAFGGDHASVEAHFGQWSVDGMGPQLISRANFEYLLFIFGSLAFLPLVGWRFSVGAAVPLGLAMLSRWPNSVHPSSHYAFLALPFVMLGLIEGLSFIKERWPRALPTAAAAGAVCALISYGASAVGPGGADFEQERYAFTPGAIDALRCLEMVPEDSPALAPDHLVAHLAERKHVASILSSPQQARQLHFALLDVEPLPWMGGTPGYERYLAHRRAAARQLEEKLGFSRTAKCGPYMLLEASRGH